MERMRRKLRGADDGNRQMGDILTAVITDRLPAVESACAKAMRRAFTGTDYQTSTASARLAI
jgi:hypothetical protein